jgi:hypothetical protein
MGLNHHKELAASSSKSSSVAETSDRGCSETTVAMELLRYIEALVKATTEDGEHIKGQPTHPTDRLLII